jgi:hypothetical protein
VTTGGYEIGKDQAGLTEKERQVLGCLKERKSFRAMAKDLGMTPQRCHQLAKSLIAKGVVAKTADGYAAIVSFDEQATFQRLAANAQAQHPTTPDATSYEATNEVHN